MDKEIFGELINKVLSDFIEKELGNKVSPYNIQGLANVFMAEYDVKAPNKPIKKK